MDISQNPENLNAVRCMKQYIEEHITDQITLHMLARAAGYSPWHCARIFKELTGKTPFEYIRAVRLSRAAIKLRDRSVRIVDVALDFVFDSHEGFTRAFSKYFGMTPRYFCNNTPLLKYFIPDSIHDAYLTFQKGVEIMPKKNDSNASTNTSANSANTVFVQVIDRPARKIILKRGVNARHYFEYCEEVGCDIWDILTGIKDALYEPIGMWMPQNLRKPGTSVYAQGIEVPVDYSGDVPEGFDVMDLPACKMMVFQGKPYDDEKFCEAIGELTDVMNNYDPGIYGFEWADEDGPRFQLAPMGYRGYIEARPVRQLNRK